MKALARALERRSEQTFSLGDPRLNEIFGGGARTASGQIVTEGNALKISAVYAAVNAIAQTVATMPFITYRRLKTGGKERAVDHPVYPLLHLKPNRNMRSHTIRHVMQAHLLLWGNAFAYIERDGSGEVVNLWPWHPSRVRIKVIGRRIWYWYTESGGSELQYADNEVLHIRNLSDDGILGYSVISLHRETLGLCQASIEYRARFFKNDARPGGVLEHPGTLSETAHKNLRDSVERQSSGENRRAFLILEEAMKWKDVGIPPNDLQFVEGWVASKEDIASLYRVPPYKIGINKSGTVSHNSAEQANLDFWTDCILWWATCWEQDCTVSLFTETEQKQYFVEMLADNMLRADSKTRAEVLQIWRRNGIINANQWRQLENLNPLPGVVGDKYIVESNMTTIDRIGEEPEPEPAPAPRPNGNGNGRYLNGQ